MGNAINLSNYELWFLLSQISPNVVIGFKNPMQGLINDDMFPIVQEAIFSLIDKDLLHIDKDNQIKISEPLKIYVNALVAPHTTILVGLRLNNNKNETIQSYHYKDNQIILLNEITKGEYQLSDIASKQEFLNLVSEPFKINIFWAPDSKEVYFTQSHMQALYQNLDVGNHNKVKELLASGEGDQESKLHFLNALQNPKINFSFVGFYNRNDPSKNHVDGFSIICDDRYIWMLEVVDEKKQIVKVEKTTLNDLDNKIGIQISSVMRL